jgi:hypothetical protein
VEIELIETEQLLDDIDRCFNDLQGNESPDLRQELLYNVLPLLKATAAHGLRIDDLEDVAAEESVALQAQLSLKIIGVLNASSALAAKVVAGEEDAAALAAELVEAIPLVVAEVQAATAEADDETPEEADDKEVAA